MNRAKFRDEQIIGMLRGQEAGSPTAEVCSRNGISSATIYTGQGKFGGLEASDTRQMPCSTRQA